MATVFLVSSGEYSDYRVHAVFAERPLAEAYADQINADAGSSGDRCDIEERELNPVVPQPAPDRFPYRVGIAKDGTITYCQRRSRFDIGDTGEVELHSIHKAPCWSFCVQSGEDSRIIQFGSSGYGKHANVVYLDLVCHAKDDSHAIKIANEKRIMFIAAGVWPESYEECHAAHGQSRELIRSVVSAASVS